MVQPHVLQPSPQALLDVHDGCYGGSDCYRCAAAPSTPTIMTRFHSFSRGYLFFFSRKKPGARWCAQESSSITRSTRCGTRSTTGCANLRHACASMHTRAPQAHVSTHLHVLSLALSCGAETMERHQGQLRGGGVSSGMHACSALCLSLSLSPFVSVCMYAWAFSSHTLFFVRRRGAYRTDRAISSCRSRQQRDTRSREEYPCESRSTTTFLVCHRKQKTRKS